MKRFNELQDAKCVAHDLKINNAQTPRILVGMEYILSRPMIRKRVDKKAATGYTYDQGTTKVFAMAIHTRLLEMNLYDEKGERRFSSDQLDLDLIKQLLYHDHHDGRIGKQ